MRGTLLRIQLLSAGGVVAAILPAVASARPADRQIYRFDIPAQDLGSAINAFARTSRRQVVFTPATVLGKRSAALNGNYSAEDGLNRMVADTGLAVRVGRSGVFIVQAVAPGDSQPFSSNGSVEQTDGPPATADIVVTAQKRTERIQDVPIAISAFSGRTLDAMKIETGGDLLKSIPNVTFSKNNFAGYNFAIRGIGTKAVAASTDPAVAVAFNSSNLIVNRLFEQEFYDIERVEVLRGPQGTLYGRNATAGVVNIISNKAKLGKTEGFLKLEEGNYETARVSGAINMPIGDRLAVRVAGAYTSRDGFAKNDYYGTRIDGRNLWSTRLTLSTRPVDALNVDLIWEHFNENDDRQRTGKQLCHKDDGPTQIGGLPLVLGGDFTDRQSPLYQPQFSQGCRDGSLYDDDAYSTPNGLSLNAFQALNTLADGRLLTNADGSVIDPYAGIAQSRDLRRFSAIINPRYRAKADVFEGNVSLDLGGMSIISQTLYNRDRYYSTQDYSRYVSRPIFASVDTAGPLSARDGVFNDPQLGPSDRLLAGDLIRTRARQFSEEIRLQSNDTAARMQYVIGANYTNLKYYADYNVFINTLTYLTQGNSLLSFAQLDSCGAVYNADGSGRDFTFPGEYKTGCLYTDNNPIGVGPGDGHNYFRSINPYRLTSWGVFGDVTYALTSQFKLIGGLRLNRDRKRFDQVPSQLLLGTGDVSKLAPDLQTSLAGFVDRGYPTVGEIRQSWSKVTGRGGLQWTPVVSFTDKSLVYATYSRGYKAGGANPPGPGFGTAEGGYGAGTTAIGQTLMPTFRPEFINSYEAGVKNTLFNGALTLNATAFFYDYKDYQVSQIIDRSSQNENFDATVWGLEFEAIANPTRSVAINANLGYQRSRIKEGQQSIDVMNRTQGREGYYVVKPFVQLPSNCVVSQTVILTKNALPAMEIGGANVGYSICQGSGFSDVRLVDLANYAPGTTLEQLYPNGGRGFFAPLGGNELPNTPHLTFNLGAQYTLPIGNDWGIIARGDVYHQSESFARVYNTVGDRLKGWENVNASLRIGNERYKFLAEVYVKNVFDSAPITDAFINSDDTGLTTNVFTLDPRTVGISLTKGF